MSFSSQVKEEILKSFSNEKEKYILIAEKFGENITFSDTKASLAKDFKEYMDVSKLDENSIKAILKGAFLSSGYIMDPNSDYQFEIVIKNKACADILFNLLSVLDFMPKITKRKNMNSYVIYIKEADQVSTILSMLEANSSLLIFESIRVEKEVKNSVNRTTNCETANLSKTVNASVKQIDAINKLKKHNLYNSLNDKLKYTAMLREKYSNESLDYLSNKSREEKYISKSGLKHRLDKIIDIANKIEK